LDDAVPVLPLAPTKQPSRGWVHEAQVMDRGVICSIETKRFGGKLLPIGREGKLANLVESHVELAQHLPIPRIPDLNMMSVVRRHEATVRRVGNIRYGR